MHTYESLMHDLSELGVPRDATVLVHSSMKAIGDVDGRADTVLDALCDYFAEGLLVLPTHTWETINEDGKVFDVLESPSCVGILPELFRKRLGVLRSWHPTHSVAALGATAPIYVEGGERETTPCGVESPWGRLNVPNCYLLMVGCTLTSCTYLHGVEEWVDIPNRLEPARMLKTRTPDGRMLDTPVQPHLGHPSEQFGKVEPALRIGHALWDGRLGDATVMVLDAQKTAAITSQILLDSPHLFDDPDLVARDAAARDCKGKDVVS